MNVGQLALENIAKHKEYTSIYYEDKSYTNVELDMYARCMATILRQHGIGKGDRVLVMMPNCPDVLAAFQACWKIGAVIVPVTPMLNVREVHYMLEHSGAEVALTVPVLAARVRDASKGIETCRHLLVIGESNVEGAIDIAPAMRSTTAIQNLAACEAHDMAVLLYTSGTTGHPKGVMLTHENLYTNAHATAQMTTVEPFMMGMHVLPLSHSFGVMMMNVGLILGVRAVMLTHFDATKALETIQNHKVAQFSVVPTMLTYLINHPKRGDYDTSSLKRVVSGGAALLNEVRLEFERLFNCEVREGYGLSETAPTAAGYPDGEPYRVGSVGRPVPGVSLCIMDNDNNILTTPRAVGEICIQGPNIMRGYWKNQEATDAAIIGDWFHSGDVGFIDEDGFLYITDRKKDLIIKGGENISPREIEEALYEHPAVSEAAVVGVPDPIFGENLCAVVVLRNGHKATEDEIKEHAAKHVTKFKVPAHVHFTSFLPKNPIGKILKKDVRKMMADIIAKQLAAEGPRG